MESTENRITIHAYNKAWKIENRIYAIQNLVLPVPVSPRAVLFFSIFFVTIWLLCKFITPLQAIPFPLRGVILPVLLTSFCLKVKLDGHSPQKYFLGVIQYVSTRNRYIEHFKQHTTPTNCIRLCWICSRGNKLKGGINYVGVPYRLL